MPLIEQVSQERQWHIDIFNSIQFPLKKLDLWIQYCLFSDKIIHSMPKLLFIFNFSLKEVFLN